jgi:DNA-binding response OmpR family regulator
MSGADDYVTKPLGGAGSWRRGCTPSCAAATPSPTPPILRLTPTLPAAPTPVAEVSATGPVLRFDGLTIDLGRHLVSTPARLVTLAAMDFDLLATLARAPGQVLSRRQLLAAVWNDDVHTDERVVDVHIRSVRRALGDDANHAVIVETVRSVGYRFLPRPLPGPQRG